MQLSLMGQNFTELNINNLVVVFDQTDGDDNCDDQGYYHISISRPYFDCYGHCLITWKAVGGGACGARNIENHAQVLSSPPLSA